MEPLRQLVEAFAKLPGIGRRTAERLAVYVARNPKGAAHDLATAIEDVRATLTACTLCGSVTSKDENPCRLCADSQREDDLLCVVEDPADIALIERSGEYRGRYFALMGKISPMRGEGIGHLRLPALLERAAQKGKPQRHVLPGSSRTSSEEVFPNKPDQRSRDRAPKFLPNRALGREI